MGTKTDETSRVPAERVTVDCEYCGQSAHSVITGPLKDEEEGALMMPPAYQDMTFRFVRCDECGLVYMRERPSPDDLDVFYGAGYMCFESYSERGPIMQMLAKMVAKGKLAELERLMPTNSQTLLDYGCGSGTWLELLRALGCNYEMIGMDVVETPLPALREKGIEAYCCDETSMFDHIEPESVGVIHLFHVIEHLPDVHQVLRQLHKALVPGGSVWGQTPNLASYGRKFWGDRWNQWHIPRHLVLFDHETLARHAEAAGFEVVKVKSSLSGATQWAHSAAHWLADKRGERYKGTRDRLYPFLILACIPIGILEMLFSHTCHMDFILRKPT